MARVSNPVKGDIMNLNVVRMCEDGNSILFMDRFYSFFQREFFGNGTSYP